METKVEKNVVLPSYHLHYGYTVKKNEELLTAQCNAVVVCNFADYSEQFLKT
jgi:hypothetical protein